MNCCFAEMGLVLAPVIHQVYSPLNLKVEEKQGNWYLRQRCVVLKFRVPRDSNEAEHVLVRISFSTAWGGWKEGWKSSTKCSIAGFIPRLRVRKQLSCYWRHLYILHSSQAEVTLSIWR